MAVTIKYDRSRSKIFGGTPYFFYKQADGRVNGRNIVNRRVLPLRREDQHRRVKGAEVKE